MLRLLRLRYILVWLWYICVAFSFLAFTPSCLSYSSCERSLVSSSWATSLFWWCFLFFVYIIHIISYSISYLYTSYIYVSPASYFLSHLLQGGKATTVLYTAALSMKFNRDGTPFPLFAWVFLSQRFVPLAARAASPPLRIFPIRFVWSIFLFSWPFSLFPFFFLVSRCPWGVGRASTLFDFGVEVREFFHPHPSTSFHGNFHLLPSDWYGNKQI